MLSAMSDDIKRTQKLEIFIPIFEYQNTKGAIYLHLSHPEKGNQTLSVVGWIFLFL